MSRYEKRVLKLRNHVKNKEKEKTGLTDSTDTEANKVSHSIAYDEVTKADIAEMLSEKGIRHDEGKTKRELYNLLPGSD